MLTATTFEASHSAEGCCGPIGPTRGAQPEVATKDHMTVHFGLTPLISLLAGILILVIPRLLNYIVAIYLIVIGLVGLFGLGALKLS